MSDTVETSTSFIPKFIKQSALRQAAKASGRRVSREAIREFDAFVGQKIAEAVAHNNGKKTVDLDSLARVGALRQSLAPVCP